MLQALLDAAVRSIGLATVVWLGLNLLRLRNPHIQLAAWTVVLGASLLMPAATRLAAVVIPPAPVVAPAVDDILPFLSELSSPQRADVTIPVVADTPAAARRDTAAAAPRTLSAEARASDPGGAWCASLIYTALAGVFLMRMIAGLLLTWRIVRAAKPLRESWTANLDIRVSHDISGPATFGAVILLPQDHADWSERKRSAVLAHETAHARRGDFYIHIAAMLNRAIFWFNPLSWWLQRRLSQLAEAASDEAAIARVHDRPLYAEILLELSGGATIGFGAVAMARPAMVRARIERILGESAAPMRISRRARATLVAAMAPLAMIAASPLAARSSVSTREDAASLEQTVLGRMVSDDAFSSPTPQIQGRAPIARPEKPAEVAGRTDDVTANSEHGGSETTAIRPEPDVGPRIARTTTLQTFAKTEPRQIELDSDFLRPNSSDVFATTLRGDRPVAHGVEETDPVVQSGGDRQLSAAKAARLAPARFAVTAPALRQSGKEPTVRRGASQIDARLQHSLGGKSESPGADAQLVATQEAGGAAPDLCVSRMQGDYDPSGQHAFFVCRKTRAKPIETVELQSTYFHPASAAEAASGLPNICFDRQWTAGDPSGQHAFYVCQKL
jgi:hypothetical protein